MTITPISMTQVNWNDLTQQSIAVLGRSPSRSLDRKAIKPGDIFSYIAALEEMRYSDSDPRASVIGATFQLHHNHLSFLVTTDNFDLLELIQFLEGLNYTIFKGLIDIKKPHLEENLLLVTGSLFSWKHIIIEQLESKSNTVASHISREFYNGIYNWFKVLNLRELFAGFNEIQLIDKTFRLGAR